MSELAVAAIAYIGSAIFHAVVHIAGHESYHTARLTLHKRLLHNHDVLRAVKESYSAALAIVERQVLANPTPLQPRRIKRSFENLRSRVHEVLDAGASIEGAEHGRIIELTMDEPAIAALTDELAQLDGDFPAELRAALRNLFPAAFRFAFMEIGIKHNEVVRSAVTQELLLSLKHSATSSETRLKEIEHLLLASLERNATNDDVASTFRDTTTLALLHIREGVSELQQQLAVANAAKLSRTGTPLARLVISDPSGQSLVHGLVSTSPISLGRDAMCDISLPHKSVSRMHTKIAFVGDGCEVEDLGSRNGTSVAGNRIIGTKSVAFGAEIAIGPYRIRFLQIETPIDGLGRFATEPEEE